MELFKRDSNSRIEIKYYHGTIRTVHVGFSFDFESPRCCSNIWQPSFNNWRAPSSLDVEEDVNMLTVGEDVTFNVSCTVEKAKPETLVLLDPLIKIILS